LLTRRSLPGHWYWKSSNNRFAVPISKLTPAEYLAIERKATFKSEYYNGEMFAMAGANYWHTLITDNLVREIGFALKGSPCRTLSHDMRVKVSATGLYTYPDIIILCGPPELEDEHRDTLLNPQVIIEVLSDSTEKYDRGKKFGQYHRLPSVREYVLVSQHRIRVERYVRQPDETWVLTVFADPAGDFALATVPARAPLADVYVGVEFPPPDDGTPPA
jgi:Uma2 family endonuclease